MNFSFLSVISIAFKGSMLACFTSLAGQHNFPHRRGRFSQLKLYWLRLKNCHSAQHQVWLNGYFYDIFECISLTESILYIHCLFELWGLLFVQRVHMLFNLKRHVQARLFIFNMSRLCIDVPAGRSPFFWLLSAFLWILQVSLLPLSCSVPAVGVTNPHVQCLHKKKCG